MMEIIEKVRSFIQGLDEQEFYRYLAIFVGVLTLAAGILMFQNYRSVNYYKRRIDDTNELREEAKNILDKSRYVQQQRAEVDAILDKNIDFKIAGYFKQLITQLALTEKIKVETPSHVDRDANYRENLLDAKFENMNMKELTELLSEIEQNKRIYTKKLEIIKSKKSPDTIEVNITIATLQPKVAPAE